jgi:hypothetical protein
MPTDPSTQLYDGACDVLAAAKTMYAAARRHDFDQAIPATLGCLDKSLALLARSSSALAEEVRRTHTLSDRPATAFMQALDELTRSLESARDACETARGKAALAAGAPVEGPI